MNADNESERINRQNQEREDELRRVPLQQIDKSKWPANVRPIAIDETDGLGIDADGRLHWNGKPVEIIGRRLDLTRTQNAVAIAVAIFTAIAAIATSVQAVVAYHDFACKAQWSVLAKCPPDKPLSVWGE